MLLGSVAACPMAVSISDLTKTTKPAGSCVFCRNSSRQNDKFGVVQNSSYVCCEYQVFNVSNDYFSIDVTGKKYALQCELTAPLPPCSPIPFV